jgi:hypothetical protein
VKRETDFEAGLAGLGFKFDFAAVPVGHDSVADNQSQAGAGAHCFGGEKRLEHMRLDFRGNAGAVIDNFNDHLIVFATRGAHDGNLQKMRFALFLLP